MAHPLTGMWIANIEQSRRDPHHQFHSATMRFEVSGDQITLAYGGINASGRQEHDTRTITADGRERVVPEASDVKAVSTLDAQALRTVATKDGAEIGRSDYVVSNGGRTMTATVSGIDAQGHRFEQIIVFGRESPSR